KYQNQEITTIDGVKIDFENDWVHMRKSNTEPIIRIYTEAPTQKQADELADRFIQELGQLSS
ncbi:MAG: phosphoglucosamine mutase, partial [Moheibacter sp.]